MWLAQKVHTIGSFAWIYYSWYECEEYALWPSDNWHGYWIELYVVITKETYCNLSKTKCTFCNEYDPNGWIMKIFDVSVLHYYWNTDIIALFIELSEEPFLPLVSGWWDDPIIYTNIQILQEFICCKSPPFTGAPTAGVWTSGKTDPDIQNLVEEDWNSF